jgi:hypothetical protein
MSANKSGLENSRYISHQNIYNTLLFILQIFTLPKKKKSVNRQADDKLCFLCCTKNNTIPFIQLTQDRVGVKLLNIPDYSGLANYVYITSNTANRHTRKGRGDGSWNRTMGVWNGKVTKTRTINSTSKLHTVVRHVSKCAVYDTRYLWSLSGYQ